MSAFVCMALFASASCRNDSSVSADSNHPSGAATTAAAHSYLGLHNVLKLPGGVISGSMPEGDAADEWSDVSAPAPRAGLRQR